MVYAAQEGVFTPPFRIGAAVVLGGLMIAASEWILRYRRAPGGRHLLAAAVAAGAGAVTLYGAVCAAYTLYGLIPFPVAAVLTAAISIGLLGLALRHGEPLALLAIFGAVIAPFVTGLSAWSPTVLLAYAVLIGLTGFTISAVRLWGRACFVTWAGLLVLSFVDGVGGGGALVVLAAAGPACAVLWRRERRRDDPDTDGLNLFRHQPAIALVAACLVSVDVWVDSDQGPLAWAALVAGVLVVLGAAVARLRLASSKTFIAPVGVGVLAAIATLTMTLVPAGLIAQLPWLYGLIGVIVVSALVGGLGADARTRTPLLCIGGVGVAVLATLTWPMMAHQNAPLAWLPAAVLGAAMFATAALIARRVEDMARDTGLVVWLAAAAQLAFLAIHAATPAHLAPVAFAAAAVVLALAARRLPWPGLPQTAVAAGLATLATLFRPEVIGAALEGRLSLPIALAVSVGAAVLLALSARLMPSAAAPRRDEAEAQDTAALVALLTGLFIGLQVLLSGVDDRAASGGLFEASLRTLLLLGAGLLLTVRQKADDGPIARWRTPIVIGLGLVYAACAQGLAWNPWWGAGAPPVGVPVINTLMIAYLAPAALLAACGLRRRPADRWAQGWTAAAIAFGFLWVLLALRHLFQGAGMGGPDIGRAESCAYAILLLITARVFARQRFGGGGDVAAGLRALSVPVGWLALIFGVTVFGFLASPWWGPLTTPLASGLHALLLLGLYLVGAWAMLRLRGLDAGLARAATAGAVGVLFVLLSLTIRWAFHGAEMGGAAPGGGLETWTYSALWAVFGLGVLMLGAGRRDPILRWAGLAVLLGTAVKVLLFDLARLEGITRAASFLAVGALFLAGALAARRLNTRFRPGPDQAGEETP
ncbi:MAG: DUF2339 domain-containing protein [Brevundimonas sp.]|nr:MAG: DUF2339 domain-containing protein [Brevundimonas sp.]